MQKHCTVRNKFNNYSLVVSNNKSIVSLLIMRSLKLYELRRHGSCLENRRALWGSAPVVSLGGVAGVIAVACNAYHHRKINKEPSFACRCPDGTPWTSLARRSAGCVRRAHYTCPTTSSRCTSPAGLHNTIHSDIKSSAAIALLCAGSLLANMSVALRVELASSDRNSTCITARRTLRTILIHAPTPAVTFRANRTVYDLAGARRLLVPAHVAVLA
jgi:hypothetical protein